MNGFSTLLPVPAKSSTVLVTTARPWINAVAAINLYTHQTRAPRLVHSAVAHPVPRYLIMTQRGCDDQLVERVPSVRYMRCDLLATDGRLRFLPVLVDLINPFMPYEEGRISRGEECRHISANSVMNQVMPSWEADILIVHRVTQLVR